MSKEADLNVSTEESCFANTMLPRKVKSKDRIFIALLFLITFISAISQPINPWPRDGWYQTQYKLFEKDPGGDNYTPIAAPALLYKLANVLASFISLELEGEFYLASILQNILIFLSVCCVFYTCKAFDLKKMALISSIALLVFILSMGLPQAFWSENIVLFLIAWGLLLSVRLRTHEGSAVSFWAFVSLIGVVIGLLVTTRVTPIFLIPGLTFFLYRGLSMRRLVGFFLITTSITLLMVIGMMASNQYRFGRFEMTNSSGRHLWQGVKSITDRALSGSPEYQRLKAVNPDIQNKSWWEIEIPEDVKTDRNRDKLLKKLSLEAIKNEPFLWFLSGTGKFVSTFGIEPYRLGFGPKSNHWDPLHRNTLLPPLITVYVDTGLDVSKAVEAILKSFHKISRWLYPFSLFFIIASFVAMGVHRIDECLNQRMQICGIDRQAKVYGRLCRILRQPVFQFVGLCVPVIFVVAAGRSGLLDTLIVMILCITALFILSIIFIHAISREISAYQWVQDRLQAFLFMVLIYVGTLWFSWQIEAKNPRNVIPYLPFWAVMLAMSLSFWRYITSSPKNISLEGQID